MDENSFSFSLRELQLQIGRAALLTALVFGMLLGIGMHYLSNQDGLTEEEEQCLVGQVGVAFLWLACFAIGIFGLDLLLQNRQEVNSTVTLSFASNLNNEE